MSNQEDLPDAVRLRSGVTRVVLEGGTSILVDWDIDAVRQTPSATASDCFTNGPWVRFTAISPLEIGRPATVALTGDPTRTVVTAPVTGIEDLVPARELSADDLATVRFVGGYINGHRDQRGSRQ
ncbi:hypothetical protein [Cryobacterium sp. MDB2-10]|uniref:hypothetical protein n=1 Tax=Cryobacterium sp. MDB2-10 TaxID=1259177 RepID=UPI0010731C73|nr:hypothetical protein [Cryobacterium sp. MDB2-10]TFC19909.1 hypothetical protein E3O51_06110 [Cryobacterium sp. MDB2-10]